MISHEESGMLLMQGLSRKFPENESICFLIEHKVVLNFVLNDYIVDVFEKLNEEVFFTHLIKLLDGVVFFYKKYSHISNSHDRVKNFHLDVNDIISKNLFGVSDLSEKIICSKGCSKCCSQLVSVSRSEADLLLKTMVEVNHNHLIKQYKLNNDTWTENLTEEEGKCVYLSSQDGSCKVWDHRPANCRNYFVAGSNEFCSVFNRNPDISRSLKSIYADVCISAFYALEGGAVSMSDYLYENSRRP